MWFPIAVWWFQLRTAKADLLYFSFTVLQWSAVRWKINRPGRLLTDHQTAVDWLHLYNWQASPAAAASVGMMRECLWCQQDSSASHSGHFSDSVMMIHSPSSAAHRPTSHQHYQGKVLPYSLSSVGPGADPSVQAVSPQVTFKSSPAVGCNYFPPSLRSPSQPKYVTVLQPVPSYTACDRGTQVWTTCQRLLHSCPQWKSNPRPNNRKSKTLLLSHCATLQYADYTVSKINATFHNC